MKNEIKQQNERESEKHNNWWKNRFQNQKSDLSRSQILDETLGQLNNAVKCKPRIHLW